MGTQVPSKWRINPIVLGWIVGLVAVGIGVFLIGFPLQTYLENTGYGGTTSDIGLIIGGLIGFVGLFLALKIGPLLINWIRSLP